MSSSTIFEPSASLTELAYRQMLLNISDVSDLCVCRKRGLLCDFSALLSWKVLQSALIQTTKCWAVRTHGLQEKFSLTIHQSSDQLCRLFFIRLNLHLYLRSRLQVYKTNNETLLWITVFFKFPAYVMPKIFSVNFVSFDYLIFLQLKYVTGWHFPNWSSRVFVIRGWFLPSILCLRCSPSQPMKFCYV